MAGSSRAIIFEKADAVPPMQERVTAAVEQVGMDLWSNDRRSNFTVLSNRELVVIIKIRRVLLKQRMIQSIFIKALPTCVQAPGCIHLQYQQGFQTVIPERQIYSTGEKLPVDSLRSALPVSAVPSSADAAGPAAWRCICMVMLTSEVLALKNGRVGLVGTQ